MEAYSRRENLIITGIPESREDTGVEDTAKVLVDFVATNLMFQTPLILIFNEFTAWASQRIKARELLSLVF